MSAPIYSVLNGLTSVRQRQPGQWSARCPSHDDRGPSLSIRETPEGAVLLHCFAGCPVGAVVGAMGLELSDLFPPRQVTGHEPKRTPRLLTPAQAIELLDREAHLVAVAAANVSRGFTLNQNDIERVSRAAARIKWLREESTGGARAY